MKFLKLFFTTFLLISSLITVSSCGMYKKVDQRQMPDGAEAKARKNKDTFQCGECQTWLFSQANLQQARTPTR